MTTRFVDLADVYASMRNAIALAGSQTRWAEVVGVSPQVINDVLNARRHPPPAVLEALGLRRRVVIEEVRASNV